MRTIGIIGSGIAGLLTAHGLRRAGYEVTLYSDRTPEQWLRNSRPTGTAARFDLALSWERELGLNHWENVAPKIEGAHLVYCPTQGNQLATLTGRQANPGLAIDVRLQSHRWMLDLEERGGKIVIENVTVPRLEEIAAAHDLTVIAAGKAELAALFPRNEARSVYAEPQRSLAMITVKGPPMSIAGVPFSTVKNNILEGCGEAVWIPYFHRDVGPCWNLIFEAKVGGPMDVFLDAKTGVEALAKAQDVIRRFAPWDVEWAKDMTLADDQGWLVGKLTPTVRDPVGRLPSGRLVASVGDTAVLCDPLAAQGANNGTKMARHFVDCVVAHGDKPFDADWMTAMFEGFWNDHGHAAFGLTNLMLEPLTPAGRLILIAQYGSNGVLTDGRQALADAFSNGFSDPRLVTPLLTDMTTARRFIAETTGQPWPIAVARGAMGIAWAQMRYRMGFSPGHPSVPTVH